MDSDVSGLVERLEGWADDLSCGKAGHGADQDVREAASTIRALVAKNERLKAKAEIAEGVGNELYRGAMDKLREAVGVIKAWQSRGCAECGGDCASANPPMFSCLMRDTEAFLDTTEKPNDP